MSPASCRAFYFRHPHRLHRIQAMVNYTQDMCDRLVELGRLGHLSRKCGTECMHCARDLVATKYLEDRHIRQLLVIFTEEN